LTYYAQAFHLALNDRLLFPEDIEAWKWGPVIPSVYKRYAGFGADPIVLPTDDPTPSVGDGIGEFLSQLTGFFRQYTAVNLSRATHSEDPWIDASKSEDNVIRQEILRDYYRSLMDVGERALSRHELLDTLSEPRWSSFYVAGICKSMMADHPFYQPALAKMLAEATPTAPKLPKTFFAPARGRDFIEFRAEESFDDTVRRGTSNT
jgi:uncharacterized phage-associated protein